MADQASSSILIDADRAAVMAVIADLASYPEWSTAMKAVTVDVVGADGRPSLATFTLDAGLFKDTFTLTYDWNDDESVSWQLVEGKMLKAQDGSYELAAMDTGTEVTYRMSVELAMPMLGMFKRKAEKAIIETALKGLKKRVESGA